jgi:hypothetical protein
VVSLALGCALGVGCAGQIADPAPSDDPPPAALDPEGVNAGQALRAAFPGFDPAHPVEVAGFDLGDSETDQAAATPETRSTVGIDRWQTTHVVDPTGTGDDSYLEGFIGPVRALTVHFRSAGPATPGGDAAPYSEMQATFAFNGVTATRAILVKGAPSTTQASQLEQAIMPMLEFDMKALKPDDSAVTSHSAFGCVKAVAILHVTIVTTTLACGAAVAEFGANPLADAKCAAGLASLALNIVDVTKACGRAPSVPNIKPAGTYLKTCNSCVMHYDTNTLSCSCKRANGTSARTSLGNITSCKAPITACNGSLGSC